MAYCLHYRNIMNTRFMFNKIGLLLTIGLFCSTLSLADDVKDPLLFRIVRNGKVTYLLGTEHTLPLQSFPQPTLSVLNEMNHIVLEHLPQVSASDLMYP